MSAKEAQGEFHTPPDSPTTPTTSLRFAQLQLQPPSLPLAPPQPIAIPLDAFLSGAGGRGESELAYFLIRHILNSWARKGGAEGHERAFDVEGREEGRAMDDEIALSHHADYSKDNDNADTRTSGGGPGIPSYQRIQPRTKEAEELAWIAIYKAKTFLNRLGEKWAQGKVGEKEMRGMARGLGLVLKERRAVEA